MQKCLPLLKFYVLSWELVPLIRICILNTVFDFSPRVWRYRGGRDGHETLQQFMYFLGKPRMSEVTGQGSDKESEVIPSQPRKVYPGVVAFCLPELLENEPGQQHSSPDVSNLQVSTIMYMYVAVIPFLSVQSWCTNKSFVVRPCENLEVSKKRDFSVSIALIRVVPFQWSTYHLPFTYKEHTHPLTVTTPHPPHTGETDGWVCSGWDDDIITEPPRWSGDGGYSMATQHSRPLLWGRHSLGPS